MNLPYNPEDKESIVAFAKKLKGKTLREICDEDILNHGYGGKGNFGQVLEKFYFLYEPNSDAEPDFPVAGLELKSTPLKQLRNKEFRSKERLVLNMINYLELVNQDFEQSSFWKKNANILLIFYLHQSGVSITDYVIKLVDEWNFPDTDLVVIKKDWETIKQKVLEGKAHELSEGDTFYLGACTKGANANSTRKQPFSDIPAKNRAYSLKQGYVNHIIASIANDSTEVFGKLIPSVSVIQKLTIEDVVSNKFKPYYGKTVSQIIELTKVEINQNAKNFYANLTKTILGVKFKQEIEEFEKAEIVVKTIRVEENNSIDESISFPAFEFNKIYQESWITSELKQLTEVKFLFIFLKRSGSDYILEKIKFWNMPFKDRNELRRVWLRTKKIIQTGKIVKEIKVTKSGKEITYNFFPKKSESKVAHVRPHGRDSSDTYPLPVKEQSTGELQFTKQCFWLNWDYVRDEIYLK